MVSSTNVATHVPIINLTQSWLARIVTSFVEEHGWSKNSYSGEGFEISIARILPHSEWSRK